MFAVPRYIVLFLFGLSLPVEYVILFNFGSIIVTPSKLVGVLMIALAGLEWAVERRSIPRTRLTLFVIAFAVSYVISNFVTLLSGVPFRTMFPATLTDASMILVFFLVLLSVQSERELRFLLRALVLGCMLVCFTALVGYGWSTQGHEGVRTGGLGGNVNELAFNIAVGLPATFAFLALSRSLLGRLFYAGALGLLMVAGVMSLSRSFYITALVMWLVGMFRFRRFNLLKYTIPGLLVFAAGIAVLPNPVWERLETLSGPGRQADLSIQSRVLTNAYSLRAFASSPLVGIGMRNFVNWVPRHIRGPNPDNVIHNVYLSVLAEQGLLGEIPFLAILVLAWREYSRAFRLTGSDRAAREPPVKQLRLLALLLQVAFLGTLIGSLFHPSLDSKTLWLLIALGPAVRSLVERTLQAAVVLPAATPEAEAAWPGVGRRPRAV